MEVYSQYILNVKYTVQSLNAGSRQHPCRSAGHVPASPESTTCCMRSVGMMGLMIFPLAKLLIRKLTRFIFTLVKEKLPFLKLFILTIENWKNIWIIYDIMRKLYSFSIMIILTLWKDEGKIVFFLSQLMNIWLTLGINDFKS